MGKDEQVMEKGRECRILLFLLLINLSCLSLLSIPVLFYLGVVRKKVNWGQQSMSVRGFEILFHHMGRGIIAVSSRHFSALQAAP